MDIRSKKVLKGKKRICDFLDISEAVLFKLMEMNLPVLIIDSHYYAHTDSLEDHIHALTLQRINSDE
jgi:hypothetical protein